MNLGRASIWTVAARIATYGLTVALGIVMARLLGPVDRGIYGVLINTALILHGIGLLGIESANIYYVAKGSDPSKLMSNSLVVGLTTGALLAGVVLALYPVLDEALFSGVALLVAVVGILNVVPALLSAHLSSLLWGLARIADINYLQVAAAATHLGAVLVAAALTSVGLFELLGISLGLTTATVVAALAILKVREGVSIRLGFDVPLARKMVGFSGAAYIANLFSLLAARADILLLSVIVGGAPVGHYAVAVSFSQMMLLIPRSVQRVVFVRYSSSSQESANSLLPLVTRTVLLASIAMAVVAGLVVSPAVRLVLGAGYQPTAVLFVLLLPGIVARSVESVASPYFTGLGRPDVPMRVSIASLVALLSLDLVLMPTMGATGAAIASSAAAGMGAAVLVFLAAKWSGATLSHILVSRGGDFFYIRSQLGARR